MDRYDSNTANGDVSEQEHIRPNSDMFDSLLTIPTLYNQTCSYRT